MLIGIGGIDRDTASESGLLFPLFPGDTNHQSETPLVADADRRALERLVSRVIPQGELPSVIETIISNMKAANIVESLQGNDAQTYIDVIDEACHHPFRYLGILLIDLRPNLVTLVDQALHSLDFTSRIRRKCVKSLYKMCAGHALLPTSLYLELRESIGDVPPCRGGSADVSKHEYHGGEVAVKVLRVHSDSRDMIKVSH